MNSPLRKVLRFGAVASLWLCSQMAASAQTVTTIRNNGPSANRVDLVVLGDGYSAADLAAGKYAADVEAFLAGMFNEQPYKEYSAYFNVHRIDVESAESGADHPLTSTYKDTAFDAAYSCAGIQRLVCVNTTKVNAVLTASIAAPNARDMILVLVNDPEYGGSGGSIAVASLNAAVVELVLHETAHSFALLADEYGGPPPPDCNAGVEPYAVNATKETTRGLIKWALWIDEATPVPTLGTATGVAGLYEGAVYCDAGMYRPTYRSKMRGLGYPFEQINTEQIVKRIYNLVSPVDGFSPASSSVGVGASQVFSVVMPQPSTHTLVRTWTLDGAVVGSGNQFTLNVAGMAVGTVHTLMVSVSDPTPNVRSDPARVLSASKTWMVTVVTSCGTVPSVVTHPSNQRVAAGAAASFSASANGSPSPTAKWQVSTNGGSTWSDISGATSTTYSFTTAIGDSGRLYRAVFANCAGSATSNSAILTVYGPASASPTSLRFGAVKAGAGAAITSQTSAQTVTVTFNGPSSTWTATTTQAWLSITGGSGLAAGTFAVALQNPGDVIGASTALAGTVTITFPAAFASPLSIPVTLTVDQTGGALSKPPIGLVESPAQNASGQMGAIGVTGWVVDDVGVRSVKIYRNCLAFEPALNCAVVNGVNLVYVGDATIVTGARPDIEIAYATYPQNNRAAWGYLLLTNMLPHVPNRLMFGGQGALTLYVLAEDMDGHKRWLGRDFITAPSLTNETPTAFTMANDTIAKPFGAIDTPKQGETVSGALWNFGWTLTPDSNALADAGDILMPLDGSTQWVYIDGVAVAPLGAYNLCRGTVGSPPVASDYCNDDVSNIFGNPTPQPTFALRTSNPTTHRNLDAGRGPIAAYYLDTTTLANGVHTIVWGVTDSAGRGEGIGSRYFTVLNGSFDSQPDGTGLAQDRSFDSRPAGTALAQDRAADSWPAGTALAQDRSFDSRPDGTGLAQDRDGPVGARHAVPVRRALGSPRSSVAGTGAGLEPGDPRQSPVTQTAPMQAAEAALREAPAQVRGEASALDTLAPATGRVWGRTGFDLNTPFAEVATDEAGVRHVQIPDLGRLELWLGAVERGYLVANGTLRDLPPGSSLNADTGVFTWSPGLGYLGTYRLVFVRGGEQIVVDVTIRPMAQADAGEHEIRMAIDVPRAGDHMSG